MSNDGNTNNKLGVLALAALVVSAMVGGGIFSLPQNMAQYAGVEAIIIAWAITGVGIFFLANTFRILAEIRPDATTGIYAYARLGFGPFAGFQMAWGYWLCNFFGNVGYAVMMMDAFNYFFPGTFTGGNNVWSIIGGSLVIWLMNFIVLAGVHQAAFLNTIGTIAKLVPILLFIVITLFVFSWAKFSFDMSGMENIPKEHISSLGSIWDQVTNSMLVTLWAFIGIEGAVVLSGKAKSQKDVGKATILGFLGCLLIYALLSLLPFGRMNVAQLGALSNPSTGPILQDIVGSWGGWVMNLGVIIALLTSWLAFTIMIAQIPYAAANDNTFPKIFKRENGKSTPSVALWVTSLIMQLTMIFVYFENNAWNSMLSITSIMIVPPYMACTAYLWKICASGQYPKSATVSKWFAMVCGIGGTLFGIWMLYSSGFVYLMLAFIFLALGIPMYIYTRHEYLKTATNVADKKIFSMPELIGAIVIAVLCVIAIIYSAVTSYDSDKAAKAKAAEKAEAKTIAVAKHQHRAKPIVHKSNAAKMNSSAGKIHSITVIETNKNVIITTDDLSAGKADIKEKMDEVTETDMN